MRLLVIGGSGLVGAHVLSEAAAAGHTVLGTYRSQPIPGLVHLDLGEAGAAERVLEAFKPEAVVHCAGWTWVDGCERDPVRAWLENHDQPVALARLCAERGIRYGYCSTSYVFDGRAGPYTETAAVSPINVYGQAKAEAERRIAETSAGQALIFRLICVWGAEAKGKNFVYQVEDALRRGQPLRLPSDQLGNPTWAGDIAWWIVRLIADGRQGLWHVAADEPGLTRVGWFERIREGLEQAGRILPTSAPGYTAVATATLGQPALRPLHAGMLTDKLQAAYPRCPRPPQAVADVIPVTRC